MKFRPIRNYWEIFLLLACLVFSLVVHWQIIVIGRSPFEFLVVIFQPLITLISCLIVGAYWLVELSIMLVYFLKKHRLKYSKAKTLLKLTAVPILILSYIYLLACTQTIRLKLSEPALMNCVNNPNFCQDNSRIGMYYVYRFNQEAGCTFFATDTWVFNEYGIAYIPPGKEKCLDKYLYPSRKQKIRDNWWEYDYES